MKSLIIAVFLMPALAHADYRLIVCTSAAIPAAQLWVKLNVGRSIVATSEDAWFESEGDGAFQKLSHALGENVYLKQQTSREADRSYRLDLETAEEILRVRISEKMERGSFEIVNMQVTGAPQVFDLTCKPDQVPSPH